MASPLRLQTRFILAASMVTAVVGAAMLWFVGISLRRYALAEAEASAEYVIARNLATHRYFTRELKPSVFAATRGVQPPGYFDPAWMSSTYAIRRLNQILNEEEEVPGYYYKECAINARSPGNEADPYERAFLERLNREPALREASGIRVLDGEPFFEVLRRGETMEQACLLCHTEPEVAPAGLVQRYGDVRSFHRSAGDVVSAVSVRIPLAAAYARVNRVIGALSGLLALLLAALAGILVLLNRRIVVRPLEALRHEAQVVTSDERRLGRQIPLPAIPEMADLTRAFNEMSGKLRDGREELEGRVRERTAELGAANAELSRALAEVKTLSGLVPICAQCKKIRDDQGFWNQIEHYLAARTEARFTHGLCPDCAREFYAEPPDPDRPAPAG